MATFHVTTPKGTYSVAAEDADEAELEVADSLDIDADQCHADLVSTFDDAGEW